MARLVVLSEGYTGRTYELKVEKTTVGRLEDNAFHIPDPSMSSHHCEVILQGSEVVVRDLNSTNGSFINNERITESPLKPGQILRLGQIEIRLEEGTPATAKKPIDRTQVIKQGVKLEDLEKGPGTLKQDTSSVFKRKTNKTRNIIIVICAVLGLVIIVALAMAVFR